MNPLNTIINADVITGLKQLDSNSIDALITSPPYYKVRNYGVEGQLGQEATPQEFVNKLLSVFDEAWRVVKDTGSVWVNLGETFNGSKVGNTNNAQKEGVNRADFKKSRDRSIPNKSMCGIPDRFKIGMIDRGWTCRDEIIWYKRNCMPQSIKDRYTIDYEKIFRFTKTADPLYYVHEVSGQLVHKQPPAPKVGVEGIDWYWREVNSETFLDLEGDTLAEKLSKLTKGEMIGKPEGTYWKKESFWYGQSYFFKTQYRPLSESTMKEIQKAYNGQAIKDYEGTGAQNPSDAKRRMIKSLNTGIKFGGNKADGYERGTYSGKAWKPTIITEYTIDTRPGLDTGNGKSGKPDDPNAGLHNSELSTKRQAVVREIDGTMFGGLKRSVWDVTVKGYKGAHFATFPTTLVEQMMDPVAPDQVCSKCGIPRFPIYQPSPEYAEYLGKSWHNHANDAEQGQHQGKNMPSVRADYRIVNYSNCGCGAEFKPGVILDPFMGAGTVALVAMQRGLSFIGVELNPEYIKQAYKRLADNGFNVPTTAIQVRTP